MPVLSKHGQLYSCSLPVELTENEKEGEEQRFHSEALPNISTLLKPLSEQECLIKVQIYIYTHSTQHSEMPRMGLKSVSTRMGLKSVSIYFTFGSRPAR